MNKGMDLASRFWMKVNKTDGCWLWTGNTTPLGYGSIRPGGERKWVLAHRVSWELHYGQLPRWTGDGTIDVCVLHHCDNPPCVRPDHLFLGTQKENVMDMSAKARGRNVPMPGENNPNAKLTWEAVRRIRERRANGAQGRALAKEYSVTPTLISHICRGRGWKE